MSARSHAALAQGVTAPSDERCARARLALEGISIGDAFGERYFVAPAAVEALIEQRALAPAPWRWTDDTAMAIAVYETLVAQSGIDEDLLALAFAEGYRRDILRGYGATAHDILQAIARSEPWRTVAQQPFGGTGSMGNGAAMRVAPVGGYFADDIATCIDHARRSAAPTHAHPDGVAGAIAVALAAAFAAQIAEGHRPRDGTLLLADVAANTPSGPTQRALAQVSGVPFATDPRHVAEIFGSGSAVIASDTVPFALWCAARHLDSFEQAMWTTVSGLGDRDTTCAIAGGIVALAVGHAGIPEAFMAAREPLAWPIPIGQTLTTRR